MAKRDDFLAAVLGRSGAAVLDRLAKASPDIEAYLLPRAAVAWMSSLDPEVVVSELPGVPGTKFVLAKARTGRGTYDGVADVSGVEYAFSDATDPHVAAVVALALGVTPGRPDLRDVDLARLGKTIEDLAKAQRKHGDAGTGLHAAAIPPEPPAAPTAAAPTPPAPKAKKPKLPKVATKPAAPAPLRLSVSESIRKCGVCQRPQFKGVEFVGCQCFSALAKGVRVEVASWGAGFDLHLTPDWDQDAILTLLEAVGKR